MSFARFLLPALQTLVWISCAVFLGIDLGTDNSDLFLSRALKFSSIVFCFALALAHPATNPRDSLLLRLALAVALFANLCLDILDQFYPGVALLSIMHLVYYARHQEGRLAAKDEFKPAVLAAAAGLAALVFVLPPVLSANLHWTLLAAVPFGLSLYAGIGVMRRPFYHDRQKHRIAAGSVLLSASAFLLLYAQAAHSHHLSTLSWVLYIPGQYLLAMSGQIEISRLYQEKYPRVQITRGFSVEADRVFDAWIEPKTAGLWLFATEGGVMKKVAIDARPGGRYTIIERRGDSEVEHAGTYSIVERPFRLVFTLSLPQFSKDEDTIEVSIRPGRRSCELTLVHHMQPGAGIHAEKTSEGWKNVLSRLASVIE